jgi:hypothetical protein
VKSQLYRLRKHLDAQETIISGEDKVIVAVEVKTSANRSTGNKVKSQLYRLRKHLDAQETSWSVIHSWQNRLLKDRPVETDFLIRLKMFIEKHLRSEDMLSFVIIDVYAVST